MVGQWRFGDVGSPLRAGLLSIYDAIAPFGRIEVGVGPIDNRDSGGGSRRRSALDRSIPNQGAHGMAYVPAIA
ncbi:hypothetical protein [Nocardia sp. NPDC057440]|uniref:hypothetical protein n=1 Tax=Nocardia sp. NPDC057440 TaxID=3346134 RepID=UPI00366DF54A